MRYQIRFLPETAKDLKEIKNYLTQYSEGAAKKLFGLLRKKIARLKDFPHSCPAYEDDRDYRVLVVGDYLVFYMVNEKTKVVEIHRIFHGLRDIRQHLSCEYD